MDRTKKIRGDILNKDIRAKELLIINENGEKLGPISRNEALNLAEEKGLDLLLVSSTSTPFVAKLLDYGKHKYEQKKKEKESKKSQQVVESKEIRLRTGIGEHDIEFKAKKVREFIEEGSRVKVSLKFRGREAARPEFGKDTLMRFFSYIEDIARIDKEPMQNGMFLDMYVTKKK